MCANSEGSGETARMRRIAWVFAGRLCDKYHNLVSWLKWNIPPFQGWALLCFQMKHNFVQGDVLRPTKAKEAVFCLHVRHSCIVKLHKCIIKKWPIKMTRCAGTTILLPLGPLYNRLKETNGEKLWKFKFSCSSVSVYYNRAAGFDNAYVSIYTKILFSNNVLGQITEPNWVHKSAVIVVNILSVHHSSDIRRCIHVDRNNKVTTDNEFDLCNYIEHRIYCCPTWWLDLWQVNYDTIWCCRRAKIFPTVGGILSRFVGRTACNRVSPWLLLKIPYDRTTCERFNTEHWFNVCRHRVCKTMVHILRRWRKTTPLIWTNVCRHRVCKTMVHILRRWRKTTPLIWTNVCRHRVCKTMVHILRRWRKTTPLIWTSVCRHRVCKTMVHILRRWRKTTPLIWTNVCRHRVCKTMVHILRRWRKTTPLIWTNVSRHRVCKTMVHILRRWRKTTPLIWTNVCRHRVCKTMVHILRRWRKTTPLIWTNVCRHRVCKTMVHILRRWRKTTLLIWTSVCRHRVCKTMVHILRR